MPLPDLVMLPPPPPEPSAITALIDMSGPPPATVPAATVKSSSLLLRLMVPACDPPDPLEMVAVVEAALELMANGPPNVASSSCPGDELSEFKVRFAPLEN